jgi:hypothetical protein
MAKDKDKETKTPPPATPPVQPGPQDSMPAAPQSLVGGASISLTEHHVKYLQANGYTGVKTVDDAVNFLSNRPPEDVASFLAGAADWTEEGGQKEPPPPAVVEKEPPPPPPAKSDEEIAADSQRCNFCGKKFPESEMTARDGEPCCKGCKAA